MNTKTLSNHALDVIDQYRHFKLGGAACSVPYWNNKVARTRAALRVRVGKGSPKDIFEEAQDLAVKNRVVINAAVNPSAGLAIAGEQTFSDEALKKMLVDENIGIDCSGFAYYILNAENEDLGKGSIDRRLHFTNSKGITGKIRAHFRPAENCSVAVLADDKNSRVIPLKETRPGDIVTMVGKSPADETPMLQKIPRPPLRYGHPLFQRGNPRNDERDHVLIIHQVDYQNFTPIEIHYVHAVAYPEDGLYGSGIKEGTIEITDPDKSILDQLWRDDNARIFERAKNSKTEIRRLKWF